MTPAGFPLLKEDRCSASASRVPRLREGLAGPDRGGGPGPARAVPRRPAGPTVAWLSMNVVVWARRAVLRRGRAHERLRELQQLLPLMLFATLTVQSIAVLGILLSIAGTAERLHGPDSASAYQSQWIHLLDPSDRSAIVVAVRSLLWAGSSAGHAAHEEGVGARPVRRRAQARVRLAAIRSKMV